MIETKGTWHRVQLELAEEMVQAIKETMKLTGAGTRSEVIRRAISVYYTMAKEVRLGGRVELRPSDGSETKTFVI
jgi:metal-responsive CopG/Arc/MetJ family transcriptional regulator